MKVIFIGDIVGSPGRKILQESLATLIEEYRPDLIIANGENAAGGKGLTPKIADELFESGIDIITMGNHVWDKKEIYPLLENDLRIVRPANYPDFCPGKGFTTVTINNKKVLIINLSGTVYLDNLNCPFKTIDNILATTSSDYIIVDFHGEATSEKLAMGWYLDGRVSAVLGTHTHVQTADHRVLNKGTLYITDVGMTGPYDGILGVEKEEVIKKFITKMPSKFSVLEKGPNQLNGVFLDLEEKIITPIKIIN
ncbi:TIGR00282 family metallophosphoesterase [Anaerobranca gottschalkii]|uniref:TIGR00282 family metallophosphoesterase n=1 Tax=Anaerobranca gottschalkii DSM 13577 TaxID=1120990 RepID=A0A1H9Z7B2_9FIRM|nr:TIGR00282 family metallophosphoesterase [Anaerobranca gottschalkii]SES77462.1 hypothetical protein SAMN03080614_100721 [Anaerobranca gottschalkii DSM 13577]